MTGLQIHSTSSVPKTKLDAVLEVAIALAIIASISCAFLFAYHYYLDERVASEALMPTAQGLDALVQSQPMPASAKIPSLEGFLTPYSSGKSSLRYIHTPSKLSLERDLKVEDRPVVLDLYQLVGSPNTIGPSFIVAVIQGSNVANQLTDYTLTGGLGQTPVIISIEPRWDAIYNTSVFVVDSIKPIIVPVAQT